VIIKMLTHSETAGWSQFRVRDTPKPK